MNINSTEQEAERRQRQIETLQSSLIHLQTQFTNAGDKDRQRAELLDNGNRPSLWEEDDDDEAMADVRSSGSNNKYTVQDYRKQQTKILDDQNEGLEALAKVISRQKHLALRIGDEVEEQNGMFDKFAEGYFGMRWIKWKSFSFAEIIGDLAVTMETTDSRVNSETRNVNFAIQNESTRGLWIIIISLFAAIVIVALV